MGDYSVHCALSGIPISSSAVVGWALQKAISTDFQHTYIPSSIPVQGFYDTYGGIEDSDGNCILEGTGMVAICHLSFWESLPGFWNKQDGTRNSIEVIKSAHKKFTEKDEFNKKCLEDCKDAWLRKVYSDKYGTANEAFGVVSKDSILYWIGKIHVGEPTKHDSMTREEAKGLTHSDHSGIFEKLFLDIIIQGEKYPNFEEVCKNLDGLVMAYLSVYYRGRPILPTQATGCEQYPNFKREKKWFGMVNKKVNELRRKEIENEKHTS